MPRDWRLLDTGLRSAAQNIALDRALLEARRANEIPTTLRFFRVTPCALLGLQHSAAHELVPAYCAAQGVPVQRRITGGAAVYMDTRHLGFSLYADRDELGHPDLRTASKHVCHAVAAAVSALGCDARYRRYDEVEVDGRVIGGCGGGADGAAVLLSGWLFTRLDFEAVVGALRAPVEQPQEHVRAAVADRMTDIARACGGERELAAIRQNIAEALGSAYDAELADGDLGLSEERRYQTVLPQIEAPDWVELVARPAAEAPRLHASTRVRRGWLRANVIADRESQMLKRVWFSGDVSFKPQRVQWDLESELRDLPFSRVASRVEWFFGSRPAFTGDATHIDFATAIARAVGQPLVQSR